MRGTRLLSRGLNQKSRTGVSWNSPRDLVLPALSWLADDDDEERIFVGVSSPPEIMRLHDMGARRGICMCVRTCIWKVFRESWDCGFWLEVTTMMTHPWPVRVQGSFRPIGAVLGDWLASCVFLVF